MCKRFMYCALAGLILVLTPVMGEVSTIEPGKLKVGVTGICTDDSPHHNCWVYKILTGFAKQQNLELQFETITFQDSWKLAAIDQLDVVATGITPLPHRAVQGASNSTFYSIVKRGLRIHREDAEAFQTIHDFVGYRVGAVKGMTSHIDLLSRAPEGLEIVATDTFEELYAMFDSGEIQGVAEGFYVFPGDEEDINTYDEATIMIDAHDLIQGQLEGNTFVIRDDSTNLLEEINLYIELAGLPWHSP